MEDKEMKVAVLGFGTVGQGVYGMLAHSKGLEPGPVLVRAGKDNEPWKVADMNAIVSDASVGADWLSELGYTREAELVRRHHEPEAAASLELTALCLADNLRLHTQSGQCGYGQL